MLLPFSSINPVRHRFCVRIIHPRDSFVESNITIGENVGEFRGPSDVTQNAHKSLKKLGVILLICSIFVKDYKFVFRPKTTVAGNLRIKATLRKTNPQS